MHISKTTGVFLVSPPRWPVNACASCAGDLEFKFRTGQILHSVANGSPGAMTRRWAPQTRYTLRRNTASI